MTAKTLLTLGGGNSCSKTELVKTINAEGGVLLMARGGDVLRSNCKSRKPKAGIIEKFRKLSEFDNRFDDCSYLTEVGNDVWLSLICVKEEYQGQGVLTNFLKEITKNGKRIIIPTPSRAVYRIAGKLGFKPCVIAEPEENINVMIYEKERSK